ncbi:hypothetical protein M885DRAFT_611637, partial [Pelagophyceae sp. CCMP2097]
RILNPIFGINVSLARAPPYVRPPARGSGCAGGARAAAHVPGEVGRKSAEPRPRVQAAVYCQPAPPRRREPDVPQGAGRHGPGPLWRLPLRVHHGTGHRRHLQHGPRQEQAPVSAQRAAPRRGTTAAVTSGQPLWGAAGRTPRPCLDI